MTDEEMKELQKLREELKETKEKYEKELKKKSQAEHRYSREENRIRFESKKRRDERTHALCFKAGHLEYVFPVIKDSSKTEFVEFINGLAAVPGVAEYVAGFVYRTQRETALGVSSDTERKDA
ncbi:DUF3847 domain-containing protein [Butyrivibrio sp. INlla14]|uniref:DUF3847 domain-containing protein n=1 Tax=Butyrivibrio sp. INlla14 TaxID=1520808 RepID=UPI000877088A|nr:DUF3847 domain-containing protein [Butyrivibrio sp. INlla14]SCY74624.1 Protein of unknown function [Butyrivibrio sp. INlla14]